MKIAISSVDGLGDFILRMPLVEALLQAGHELRLFMRPPAAALAEELFPETRVVTISADPFHPQTKKAVDPFARELADLRLFAPDIYVVSAFHPTFFDELALPETSARVTGLVSEDELWPSDTSAPAGELAQNYTLPARVPASMPEGEKALVLAETLLGAPIVPSAARHPSSESRGIAEEKLARLGLQRGQFIVVCAGSRSGLAMKDWGEKKWTKALSEIAEHDARPMVFLGNPKEAASIDRIRGALPPHSRHFNLAADPPPVGASYALVAASAGYLGRDSGVMHMATAADVPIVALFGGGHWPRFLPRTNNGIVLTVKVPCRGCQCFCPFEEPFCITQVPCGDVVAAWDRLPSVHGLEIVEVPPSPAFGEMACRHDFADHVRKEIERARSMIRRSRPRGIYAKMRRIFNQL